MKILSEKKFRELIKAAEVAAIREDAAYNNHWWAEGIARAMIRNLSLCETLAPWRLGYIEEALAEEIKKDRQTKNDKIISKLLNTKFTKQRK